MAPTHKDWQVHAILTGVETTTTKTTTGLCLAIPITRKGPTRFQLRQLKKFVMEIGFGQTIIQVDNEPAILQLAQEAARELTIPWRHYSSHSHQGQEALLRYVLQHACFTINRYLVHADGLTNYQLQSWSNEQKVEAIWLGKITNSGEHVMVKKENIGKIFYTRRGPEFDKDDNRATSIDIPQMDTTMDADYIEEDHIGNAIIEQFFTKTRLTQKQLER
eukprot:4106867-Amphidinium_carterae.1